MGRPSATTLLRLSGPAWVLLAPLPLKAANVQFLPRLSLGYYYAGNVQVVGEAPQTDEELRADLVLDLNVRTRATTLGFSYAPYYQTYREATELTNTGHAVSFHVERSASERTQLGGTVSASRTERQSLDPNQPGAPTSYIPRTRIDSGEVGLNGSVATGRRSSVQWSASGSLQRPQDAGGIDFENSKYGTAGLDWQRQVSQRATLGIGYAFSTASFETLDPTQVQSLGLVGTRQFQRNLVANYRLGVLRAGTGSSVSNDVDFDLNVSRSQPEGYQLAAGARQTITAGTGLTGATLDRGAYVGWSYARARGWTAGVNVSYWQRESVVPGSTGSDGTNTFSTDESVSWWLNAYASIGLSHSFVDQVGLGSSASSLTTRYNSGGLFFRWNIVGR